MSIAIYGLFSPDGSCLYIGQSVNPSVRFSNHRSQRFHGLACSMRVLRHCQQADANRLEVQIMRAYRARGQATMNRVVRPGSCRPYQLDELAVESLGVSVTRKRKRAYQSAASKKKLTLTEWVFKACDAAAKTNSHQEQYPRQNQHAEAALQLRTTTERKRNYERAAAPNQVAVWMIAVLDNASGYKEDDAQ